jgi:glycosyltransferase involved in cell wall biosynthesis
VDWKRECAVVIPCLNEQEAIGPLVATVREYLPSVMAVDDGSTDETGKRAQAAGAELLRHDVTCGKGAALQTGCRHAQGRGFNWILAMDGDGQHSPEDIPKFLRCADETQADLVVGNRMHDTSRMPWVRRMTNRWMSEQLSALTGRKLPDTQCGFRLMNLETWAKFPGSSAHFEIESELLLAFSAAGARIEFVPIQVIYRNERSKINPLRDTVRWFRWRRNARRFLHDFRQRQLRSSGAAPAK